MPLLDDKIALVTGASRGFGFAAARAFARKGAHVVALARTLGGLEELDDRIVEDGGERATLVPLDITDDPGIQRMAQALHGRFGRVNLWLHTAAFAPQLEPAHMIAEKDLDKALTVNVRAFQRLVRMIDPLLRLAPRAVGLVAAAPEEAPKPFWGTYAATKAAQSALTRAWAEETKRQFTVAEVVPPPMPTALRSRFYPGQDRAGLVSIDEAAERLVTALGRPIAPGARLTL
jgi:NAD(P)-dependent dehydrogenase (short-subunit alcohol dehydrogenase family)